MPTTFIVASCERATKEMDDFMPIPQTLVDRVLYVCFNEECDVTADLEHDAAIERMRREYGGAPETYRVTEMHLKVPVAGDYIDKLIAHLPDERRAAILLSLEDNA